VALSLAVVGSIAFDSVKTPFGEAERQLGGSATYAALAAAHFTGVRIVGPVGDDFPAEHYQLLMRHGVVAADIEHIPGAETFFWRGHYDFDMSVAHTDETELNVFHGWRPGLSREARASDLLFLASMDPEVQAAVRAQWSGSRWCALDTMGFWIETKRDALIEAVSAVDIVLMNDQEARALTRKPVLLHAAREIAAWGPRAVVLKLGEYGCALLTEEGYFSLPGYPLEAVADPTGAGDAFAGGFLGYLDLTPGVDLTEEVLRRAVTYGSVMASYCVERFGTGRIAGLTDREVSYRFGEFAQMTHFERVDTSPRPHDPATRDRDLRLERPQPTPTTGGIEAPRRTAGTPRHKAPQRTPSTKPLPRPGPPLPPPKHS
jgi:sugar/nucleoside kinase (ribokinase family)